MVLLEIKEDLTETFSEMSKNGLVNINFKQKGK